MKKTLTFLLLLISSSILFAQNEIDAFRFSQVYYSGTSRSMGMAGSFGALGGDASVASTNPAGIGIFKHDEFNFTPSFLLSTSNSNFNGTVGYSDKFSFHLDNMAYVSSSSTKKGPVKFFNFSFGYNRTNNFKNNLQISGVNDKGSIMDSWMLDANGHSPDQLNSFTTYPAFMTYLLDTVPGDALHYTNPLWWIQPADGSPLYGETQTQYVQTLGGAGEYYGNFAINIADKLFAGVTIGIPSFSYKSYKLYTESNFVDSTDLSSLSYEENLTDKGSGINIKAGLIFMPVKFIRIGAAIHSPTYYSIQDYFSTTVNSHWKTPDPNNVYDYNYGSDENRYSYHLLTPMRAYGSLAIIAGKYALIDVDYEYVNYSGMRMSANDYLFIDENNAIRDNFQATYNIHGGAEINFGYLRLRGGYALFGNPYKNSANQFNKTQITGGLGLYFEDFYIDLAYIRTTDIYNVYMYNGYTDEPVPTVTRTDNLFNFTLGFKF